MEMVFKIIGGLALVVVGFVVVMATLDWIDARKRKKQPKSEGQIEWENAKREIIYEKRIHMFRGEECADYEAKYHYLPEQDIVELYAWSIGGNSREWFSMRMCYQDIIKRQMYEEEDVGLCVDYVAEPSDNFEEQSAING